MSQICAEHILSHYNEVSLEIRHRYNCCALQIFKQRLQQ